MPSSALTRAARLIAERLRQLEERITAGDESAWAAYLASANTLAALLPQLTPESRGALMTTAEMASRYGISPKTLLKRKARGEVRPAVQEGKFIRWRGNEALNGNGHGNATRK